MNGETLYNMWREALLQEGVASDPWDDLEESDRAAWDRVAEQVERK